MGLSRHLVARKISSKRTGVARKGQGVYRKFEFVFLEQPALDKILDVSNVNNGRGVDAWQVADYNIFREN